MQYMNIFRTSNKRLKLLTALLLVTGATALHAQDAGSGRVVTFDLGTTFDLGGDTDPAFDRFTIKSNLLYLAGTVTPNLGFDVGLGARTSIGVVAGYNNWGNLWDYSAIGPEYDENNFYRRRLDHLYGKIEFRYWFGHRFEGNFIGINAFFADYNIGELSFKPIFDKRYNHDGNVYGAGLSYGYLWRWTPRWGMEFTLGLGVAVLEYDKNFIEIGTDGFTLTDRKRYRDTYVGPTNIGINLVFKL